MGNLILSIFKIQLRIELKTTYCVTHLFRGSTPFTLTFVKYWNRISANFLIDILKEPVMDIGKTILNNESLDIKNHNGELTEKIIIDRKKKLLTFADLILDRIVSRAKDVPIAIRWIINQTKILSKQKFPSENVLVRSE